MKTGIYAVKDTKIGFEQPFSMQNDEVAIRAYLKAEIPYKEDTELYKIGEYDNQTGNITPKVKFMINSITKEKENEL